MGRTRLVILTSTSFSISFSGYLLVILIYFYLVTGIIFIIKFLVHTVLKFHLSLPTGGVSGGGGGGCWGWIFHDG